MRFSCPRQARLVKVTRFPKELTGSLYPKSRHVSGTYVASHLPSLAHATGL